MKGSPKLWLPLFVAVILVVTLSPGGWSALPSAASAPGADLQVVASDAASTVTLLAVADATLKSGFPNANFGGTDYLDLEYASGGRTIARALLRFDLGAGLPSGSVIDSAQLQVRLNSGTGVNPITVRASAVQDGWAELGVTWDTQPSIGDPHADAQVGTTQAWYYWDVTAIARGWQTGRNYGLELRGPESGADWYRTFRSSDPGEAEPRLVVNYTLAAATPTATPTGTPTSAATPTRTPTPTATPATCTEIQIIADADSWNDQLQPTANHGTAAALTVGKRVGTTPGNLVALAHFSVNSLPPGAWIERAWMELYQTGATGPAQLGVWADALTSKWIETTVTWANMPTAVDVGVPPLAVPLSTGIWRRWDVADLVQHWVAGDGQVAGVLLRGDGATVGGRTFAARESSTPPRLVVCYSLDTTPPENPHSFTADHSVNQWSNNAWISGHWDGASDGAGSGVFGYSIGWSASPATVPDAVLDTTTNQDTQHLADGLWYLHVRTRDVAGNWNTSAAHFGPYKIDTTPPTNPTITSATHTPGTWSKNPSVLVSWSGASDGAGSGLAGSSIVWDAAASTAPDATVDTTGTTATSSRPDGSTYFHLRTKDVAGNWTSTIHFGPLKIDTVAPVCTVAPLPAYAGLAPFSVSWAGADSGSGVASYDVQYRDGGGAWIDWHTWTTSLSANFTGARAHTYAFRCRARDGVGNQGAYPAAADASTRVGRTLTIQVRYGGSPAAGAKVYRSGELLGVTDAGGNLAAADCVQGDTLAAHHAIYNQPSLKRPADPAWVVYATNVTIPVSGDPQLYVFGDIVASPNPVVIDVDGNRPLIGFRVVFSVEWDAPSDYLDDLRQGAVLASQYLYDATDGQMFWEYVDIFDNRVGWDWTDYRVQLDNRTWPCGDVGGIMDGAVGDHHIYVGRVFGRGAFKTLSWTNWDAYPTLDHEFGHYGLGLWDEYLDRKGNGGGSCATNYATQPQASRSSMMYHEWDTTELCSTVDPNHRHNTQTYHDFASGGESTWQTVLRRFADPAWVDRWTLQSPVERGQIVPGPNALPGNWVKSNIVNHNTGACAPFDMWASDNDGHPIIEALVWLDRAGIDLTQGVTDANGHITVYGAHNGETLMAQKDGASGSMPVSCGPGPVTQAATPALTIPPAPFALEIGATAASQDRLDIIVKAGVFLVAPPAVEVQQVAGTEPLPVVMIYDAANGLYRGQATLPLAGGTQGFLRVEATDVAGHSVIRLSPFKLLPVPANETTIVRSADNVLRVTFPAGSLSSDTIVTILATPPGAATQGELVRVGDAYAVTAAGGQTTLAAPASVLMYYPVGRRDVESGTLQLHRWDTAAGRWVEYGGTVNAALNLVSAQVSHLGTFAILGERATPRWYLPLALRTR